MKYNNNRYDFTDLIKLYLAAAFINGDRYSAAKLLDLYGNWDETTNQKCALSDFFKIDKLSIDVLSKKRAIIIWRFL